MTGNKVKIDEAVRWPRDINIFIYYTKAEARIWEKKAHLNFRQYSHQKGWFNLSPENITKWFLSKGEIKRLEKVIEIYKVTAENSHFDNDNGVPSINSSAETLMVQAAKNIIKKYNANRLDKEESSIKR
ncbi:hypothetical protein LCGC14_1338290 [marine sediment metagenome]|uniref:Uncharacterized protein n=1 Tax=marine sediment metagenome TaxID=412755 RepID=A0A0F9KF62_9ZZZZ